MTTPFWTRSPSILMNKNYILELWPVSSMCYEAKLNAISRLVIIICILGYISTMNIKFILIGIITLAVIIWVYTNRLGVKEGLENTNTKPTENTNTNTKPTENIDDKGKNEEKKIIDPLTLQSMLKSNFSKGTPKNPFSNVLLTDIMDNPDKKPAEPSFNPDVYDDITENTKLMVQSLNPGIKNVNRQLFGSLIDQFDLERSNRQFVSNANTRVTNDQGAFANYLYGDMPSCRNGDGNACIQNNFRYNFY